MTPRCWAAWSSGKAKAAERDIEHAIVLSWLTGARSGEAFGGKLRKLDRYLPRRPAKAQTTDEMLAVFKAIQARVGSAMNIKKLH